MSEDEMNAVMKAVNARSITSALSTPPADAEKRSFAAGEVTQADIEIANEAWRVACPVRQCAASPSVVADEPDGVEVTVSEDEVEIGARKLANYLYAQPTEEDNVPYDEACPRDQERYREAYRAVRRAAHEAGKREGREEAAKVAESQRKDDWFEVGSVVVATGKRIATAIRALSQNGGEGNG